MVGPCYLTQHTEKKEGWGAEGGVLERGWGGGDRERNAILSKRGERESKRHSNPAKLVEFTRPVVDYYLQKFSILYLLLYPHRIFFVKI